MMTSAVSIATSAWRAICALRPFTLESQPPVSCTQKRWFAHSAKYEFRSRVTPGTSSTTASRRPKKRFVSEDLPTLGRPTIATVHRASSTWVPPSADRNSSSNAPQSGSPAALEALVSCASDTASENSASSKSTPVYSRYCVAKSFGSSGSPESVKSSPWIISIIRCWTSSSDSSEVSTSTASSAGRSGEAARAESAASRRWTSASTAENDDSRPAARFWSCRRCARISAEAVRKIFVGASPSTTVPISRPSTITRWAAKASSRCNCTKFSRTSGIAETDETCVVTACPRIGSETSSPSRSTALDSGSSLISIGRSRVASMTA